MKPFSPQSLTYFFLSRASACPYLEGRVEQMVFTDLSAAGAPQELHNQLSRAGFRRSQGIAYKPNCQDCNACQAVRVPVERFASSRSLNRIGRRNAGITATVLPPKGRGEHYALFHRYVASRHGDGGMAGMSFDDYLAMVQDTPVPSELIEFRTADGDLYGVCLTDLLDDGLSLVYSIFDPDMAADSPGKYIILWHIEEAKRRGLPHVYLGYWIEESRKMAYKARFRPLEAHGPDGWSQIK
ncbi:MAG: arginyltransferase [Rhodospirillaceae bacterium]|nr:arginyltransferase [Rhodospirillaceae bacterium]MBT5879632.1 arginyltransferase [Rhodospirillaceae bacterium]